MARAVAAACAVALLVPSVAAAQQPARCHFVCGLDWKLEPTVTIAPGERVFEMVFAADLETRLPRLGFTAEAIAAPFGDDNEAELEFEANFHWLTGAMTRGWLTSHVDVVDQFSPAARPLDRRPYTHKLDFELDTAFHPFNGLPDGRWLRGLELETSLDYLATGLAADASGWSVSFVIVIPVAPF